MEEFIYKTNLMKRIFATLLDYGVFFLAIFAYTMYFGHSNNEGGKTVSGFLAFPILIVWFIYFVMVETFWGATFGHQAFDLKVITLKREKIQFTQALKRHLLDPIDILFCGIPAIITIKNTEKHQRLGDLWANTIVVNISDEE